MVVNPSEGQIPLGLYLPGLTKLPPGGAAVREVVAVGVDPGGPGSDAPAAPGPTARSRHRVP